MLFCSLRVISPRCAVWRGRMIVGLNRSCIPLHCQTAGAVRPGRLSLPPSSHLFVKGRYISECQASSECSKAQRCAHIDIIDGHIGESQCWKPALLVSWRPRPAAHLPALDLPDCTAKLATRRDALVTALPWTFFSGRRERVFQLALSTECLGTGS